MSPRLGMEVPKVVGIVRKLLESNYVKVDTSHKNLR
tara:strand:- start:219 stop:326 length:108 start_codon:yes stop_codon:yes gene_type:complete